MRKKRRKSELFDKRCLLGITENLEVLPEEAETLKKMLQELDDKLLQGENDAKKE